MKMKLRDVTRHYTELAGLGELVLPSKLSFAVSCNLERLQKEAGRIEKERKKLCERYADRDGDGKPAMADSIIHGVKTQEYQMSKENRQAFSEEYDALLETEVEVGIRTAKMEEVERCEQAERYDIPTVAQLLAMSFMLEE